MCLFWILTKNHVFYSHLILLSVLLQRKVACCIIFSSYKCVFVFVFVSFVCPLKTMLWTATPCSCDAAVVAALCHTVCPLRVPIPCTLLPQQTLANSVPALRPRASLSQIESQILLGRRGCGSGWMVLVCHVMSADEWPGPRGLKGLNRGKWDLCRSFPRQILVIIYSPSTYWILLFFKTNFYISIITSYYSNIYLITQF